jgi:hypothetical protein
MRKFHKPTTTQYYTPSSKAFRDEKCLLSGMNWVFK